MAITPYHKPVSGQPVDTYAPINWDFINQSLQQKDVAVDSALAKGQETQGILAGLSATDRVNVGDTFDTYMPYSSILKEKSDQYNQKFESGYLRFQETGNVGEYENFIKQIGREIGSDQELQFIQSVNNNALKAQEAKSKVKLPHDNPTNMMPINLHLMQILQGTAQWNNELPPPTQHERDDQLFERINKMAKDVKEKSTESFLKLGVNAKGQPVDHFRNNVSLLGYDKVPGFENVVDVLETYGKYKEVVPFANVYMASMTEMQRHANSFFANKLNSVLMTKPNITVEEAQQIEEALRKEYFKPPDKVPKLGKDGEPVLDKNGNPIMLDDFTTAGEFWQTANDYSNHMGEVYSQFQQSVHRDNISFSGKDGDGSGTGGKSGNLFTTDMNITPAAKNTDGEIIPNIPSAIYEIAVFNNQIATKEKNGNIIAKGSRAQSFNTVSKLQDYNYEVFNYKDTKTDQSVGIKVAIPIVKMMFDNAYNAGIIDKFLSITKFKPLPNSLPLTINEGALTKNGEELFNALASVMHYDVNNKYYNFYGFLIGLGNVLKDGTGQLLDIAKDRGYTSEDIESGLANLKKVFPDYQRFATLPRSKNKDNTTEYSASIKQINTAFTQAVTKFENKILNTEGDNNVKRARDEQNKGKIITVHAEGPMKSLAGYGKSFNIELVNGQTKVYTIKEDEDENLVRSSVAKKPTDVGVNQKEVEVSKLKDALHADKELVFEDGNLIKVAAYVHAPQPLTELFRVGNLATQNSKTKRTVYFGDTTTEKQLFTVNVTSKIINGSLTPVYTMDVDGAKQEVTLPFIYEQIAKFYMN